MRNVAPTCPQCGKQFDPDEKFVGAYARAEGWTPEIVARAARETGLSVHEGVVRHGVDPTEWLGLWRSEECNLGPFWDRARELRMG